MRLTACLKITPDAGAERKYLIFLALSYKCFETARAIQLLCDQGLYDDAFALLRVLIEATINAVYILNAGGTVADDYADYPKFQAGDQLEQIRAVAPELADIVPVEEQSEIGRQFEQVRPRYEGNRNADKWTKDNIFERAKFIDAKMFPALINVTWKDASAYVHSTARSIEWRIRGSNVAVGGRTPAEGEIATVIYYSNMTLFTLILYLDKMAGSKGMEEWRKTYEEWSRP